MGDTDNYAKSAILSADGVYRYHLVRMWDAALPAMTWVMLNPSTADATQDDPTIRKCITFAKNYRCGSINVVNCYALRSTDPRELMVKRQIVRHAHGPDNRRHVFNTLRAARENSEKVVCGWGNAIPGSGGFIKEEAARLGVTLWCLKKTIQGEPQHPLYIAHDTELIPYP